jgi:hypothetical protein
MGKAAKAKRPCYRYGRWFLTYMLLGKGLADSKFRYAYAFIKGS